MASIVPINTDSAASVLEYRASLGLGTSILTGTLNATNVNATTITLGAPLVLGSSIPSDSYNQLGYSFSVPYSGPANLSTLTSGVPIVYGTTTVAIPGVYLVSCGVGLITAVGSLPVKLDLIFSATNVTVGSAVNISLPLPGTAMSYPTPTAISTTALVIVPFSTSSSFTLSVGGLTLAGGNTLITTTTNYRLIVTRVG